MVPVDYYIVLSAILFSIGALGVLSRRNPLIIFMSIELMLNAANLNFIAFWKFAEKGDDLNGWMFAIFSIAIAAAEAAVGLALVIAIYRHYRTTNVDAMDSLKG